MKKTTIAMLCLAACFAAADTKITWLADVTADRAETVTGVQSGQVANAVAHINRTDNPHGVTAPQIGALTNELDLAALRTYHYGSPDIVESPAEWFFSDGAGTITAFNWEAGRTNVVIPWAIGGVPVTAIGAYAFSMNGIVSLIAPQTVTSIEESAFFYCGSLASVSLPQAQTVGIQAFYFCTSLTSVLLPQAQTVRDYAFAYCDSLASVYIDNDAPTIGADIFANITPNQLTNYVTNPTATGWGATFAGMPVVRLPLYADAITLNGDTITEWPVGGGETSIIAPLYDSGTNVTVTSTQSVYSVAVTGAGPVGIDWSGLALDGTGRAEVTLRLNVTEWGGTNVTFSPSLTFDRTPEILVTGVWEFACSTIDGTTTRVKQTWPEVVECNVLVPQIVFGGSASLAYGGNRLQTLGTGQDGVIQYYWPLCAADVVMVRIDAAAAQTSGFPLGSFCDYRVEGYNVSISPIVTNRCEITVSNSNVGGPVTTFRGTAKISEVSVSSMIRLRRLILPGDPSSTNAHVWVNAAYRELNANERAAYEAGWRP